MGLGAGRLFVLSLADCAREYLLREGTDLKYGARHLKRTIERALVAPLSNLIASSQVTRGGAMMRVSGIGPRMAAASSTAA